MTRSLWKGAFVDASLLRKRRKEKALLFEQPKITKVWSRRSCILPEFVGRTTQVYNGHIFINLRITEDMVGHKFGEFASTRKKRAIRKSVKRT